MAFPLEKLRSVRELRLETSLRAVQVKQRAVMEATQAVVDKQAQIDQTGEQRAESRRRLYRTEQCTAPAMDSLQRHIEWLADQIERQQAERLALEQQLTEAKEALQLQQREYRKLDAKCQALQQVKNVWQGQQYRRQEHARDIESEEIGSTQR